MSRKLIYAIYITVAIIIVVAMLLAFMPGFSR
jgi:hypothetical protein